MDSILTIYNNGIKKWKNYKCQLHREGGPAIEYSDGSKVWYRNGQRHREDGPAIEHYNGLKMWYLNDIKYTEQEYKKKMRSMKIDSLNN